MAFIEDRQSAIPAIKEKFLHSNRSRFQRDPLSFLSLCHRFESPLIAIDNGVYVVVGPELVESVFHEKAGIFLKSLPGDDQGMVSFPASVMNSAGDDWRRKRKALQPGFHLDRIDGGVEGTIKTAERHLEQWHADVPYSDIREPLQLLCLDVGCQYLSGTTLADEERLAFVALADAIMLKTRDDKRFPLRLFDRAEAGLAAVRHKADDVADAVLARVRQRRSGDGCQDGFGSSREHSGAALDGVLEGADDWLRDEFCAMVLSGLEPMTAAIAWTLHLLTLNPEVLRRVVAEVDAVALTLAAGGSSSAAVVEPAVMAETRAALKEALRLFPPAWLTGRIVSQDTALGGFFLPRGSALIISPWVNHRSSRHFDAAGQYRPERWLDGTLERQLPRYAFFPFGGGRRRCIGDHFSMTHMTAILFCILRRFALKAAPGGKVRPYPALVLRPLGIGMILTHRAASAATDRNR